MWYPAAYVYPREKQHALSASLRKNLLDRFCARVNGVRPRHVIHAAGPPCFLEPASFHLNFQENSIFYDQSDVFEDLQARLEARLHLVLPGDTLEWGPSGDLTIHRLQDFDFSRKREALAAYEESRRGSIEAYLAGLPQPAPGFLREFMRHIAQLAGSSRLLRERADGLIRFHISGEHGGLVELDTCDGRFHLSTQPSAAGATYEFELDGRVARQLVEGRETWESVLLSMRFRARRDPDTYNWPLFALLRYGHDPVLIRRIEQRMGSAPPETLTVQDGRDRYLIGRYCPHTGEDLAGAQICDGRLTCPRHHWVFDLREAGRCVAGGNISLARCELMQGGDPAPVRSGPVALQDDEQDD
jgi:UDP-MurNAc hydroxylase